MFRCGRPMGAPAASQRLPRAWRSGHRPGRPVGPLPRPGEAVRTSGTRPGRALFESSNPVPVRDRSGPSDGSVPMWASHGRSSRVPAAPASLAVGPEAGPARGTPAEAWRSREDARGGSEGRRAGTGFEAPKRARPRRVPLVLTASPGLVRGPTGRPGLWPGRQARGRR